MEKDVFPSESRVIHTSCGKFYLHFIFDHEEMHLIKVLAHAGKAGGCASAHLTSSLQKVNSLLNRNLPFSERLQDYTEMCSIQCYLPDSCVQLIANHILNKELTLSERRKKYAR